MVAIDQYHKVKKNSCKQQTFFQFEFQILYTSKSKLERDVEETCLEKQDTGDYQGLFISCLSLRLFFFLIEWKQEDRKIVLKVDKKVLMK